MRRHYLLVGAAVVIVLAGAGFLWREVKPYVAPVYRDVAYTVPTAPKLSAGTGETVYRVDPVRSEAAYAVGYESPTHFSRDYSRKFGLPPSREATMLIADRGNGRSVNAVLRALDANGQVPGRLMQPPRLSK